MEQFMSGEIIWFKFNILKNFDNLITHGIFTRKGGVSQQPFATLNAGFTVADDPTALAENYRRIQATLSGQPRLVSAIPAHHTDIMEITAESLDDKATSVLILPNHVDGLLTQVSSIGLFWAVADCTTLSIVDPIHHAIGMVHAGWRGTSQAIIIKALHMMNELYRTRPADVYVGLSPTIGPCCYEVDERVRAAFEGYPIAREHGHFTTIDAVSSTGETYPSLRLDLVASNRSQLLAAGVPEEQIEISDFCTGCDRNFFFSHRMENGNTGRFATVLGLL